MKTTIKIVFTLILAGAFLLPVHNLNAGNDDRAGQAGAMELLINPFARSSGWGDANSACITGLEAMYLNVAGTAFTKKSEFLFAQSQWLRGSGITISNFGFTQSLGGTKGVLGINVMAMNFGDIEITTVNLPEGGIGNFSPKYMNIGISYAKAFSNSIYGGATVRIINQSLSDVSAQGLALDAGIQYVTGSMEQMRFGISMKNVGPRIHYSGDGLSIRGFINTTDDNQITFVQRSEEYELPSLIKIGGSYDFFFGNDHKLTAAANFTSNSFTKDQIGVGVEYSWNHILYLRGGYVYERGILNDADRTTALTGPTGGFSVNVPLNKEKGTAFSVDYSYRASQPFGGTHTVGARISI
ncbi:MAG TPA: PorV/PorQ family protein [Bacteroidales bacterium]|nr:PorV/PorQ family protein [Bacteroidales bacterium]HRZ48785.1 PorV/PorQ family protein [Bacteroidales bacterium]